MPKGQPGTKGPHGTISRYTSHGCRCDECRRAIRHYYRQLRGHRPRQIVDAEREPAHGTESRYTNWACRCDDCREASRKARARRREAVAA